jgi:hypothetical protein
MSSGVGDFKHERTCLRRIDAARDSRETSYISFPISQSQYSEGNSSMKHLQFLGLRQSLRTYGAV